MNLNWILAGIITGPLLYILVTLGSRPSSTVEEFEYGARKLDPKYVLDSSIMYALQVAAIALFATWGYLYGFAAIIVPFFWLLGYIFISFLFTDRFLTRFALDKDFRTLHNFLADNDQSRMVCIVAAMTTLIGLAGPAMFEAFTVGRAITAATPAFGPAGAGGLALAFILVAVIYMTRGGFPGVVRLDRLQLAIGFGGFSVAFSIALNFYSARVGEAVTQLIGVVCLLSVTGIAVAKYLYDKQVTSYFGGAKKSKDSIDFLGLFACGVGVIAFALTLFATFGAENETVGFTSLAKIDSTFGFTILATISLFVANSFYQFVDVTQWQRLLSIAVDENNLACTAKILRNNVLVGGVCSSLTWVVAVTFGVFLKHLFPESSTDAYSVLFQFFSELSTNESTTGGVMVFLFIASLVAIMFSTLDSLVSATAFTVQHDIITLLFKKSSTTTARAATVVVIIAQLLLYLAITAYAKDHADAVLYVCWSFQLALLPVVVGLLLNRGGNYMTRTLSIVAGCFAAISPLAANIPDRVYEISPWLTVLVAGVVYFVLGGASRIPNSIREAELPNMEGINR